MASSGPLTLSDRAAGILLHISSLPSPFGIGDLGPTAADFARWMAKAGQRWWQVLPLSPPGQGFSPYSATSAFAGNPLFISPYRLYEQGLLKSKELTAPPLSAAAETDYEAAFSHKHRLFRMAYARFRKRRDYEAFVTSEADWLADYALFAALEERDGGTWTEWEPEIRRRDPSALRQAREQLADSIGYHTFLQYEFFRQWRALRALCRGLGVGVIGDLPIFVAHHSADVWAHQDLFHLDDQGRPVAVAGVPPDLFSKTGQRWGNPLYNWDRLQENVYAWWVERFRKLFGYFDVIRLDHFIGFHRFWEIPAAEPTAEHGRYILGPGAPFFTEVFRQIPNAQFIAEDLGAVVPEVVTLRRQFGFPGMNVLQFAFNGDPRFRTALPFQYEPTTVVYTGTHDNNTTLGWYQDETRPEDRQLIEKYVGKTPPDIPWDLIRIAYGSVANTAVVPMQDVLGFDASARMNFPGKAEGNWLWRLKETDLTPSLAARLRDLSETFDRVRQAVPERDPSRAFRWIPGWIRGGLSRLIRGLST